MMAFQADEDALAALSDDVGGLWCRRVAVLESMPDSFTFLRDFVQPNVPCIIKNAILDNANGVTSPLKLTLDQIIHHVGKDAKLTVDVTPDGHGDCIRSVVETSDDNANQKQKRMFVKPHEEKMEIGKFLDLLRQGHGSRDRQSSDGKLNAAALDSNGLGVVNLGHTSTIVDSGHSDVKCFFEEGSCPAVVYYSRQNDCLRKEMTKLFSTQIFPTTFAFAEQAFDTGPPDAINLWIGNEQSVSSMHKDHYENLFYVCSGQKEFILCPPSDVIFLHEDSFSSGQFHPTKNVNRETHDESRQQSWVVIADDDPHRIKDSAGEPSEATTKWIEPDVKKNMENTSESDKTEFPLLSKAHPIKVLVSEGEMLYIPSLWYHRVTQTCETVGVNYWFDMKFDSPMWCYFNFLQNLRKGKGILHKP